MYNISKTILAAEKVLKRIKETKGKISFPINPFELLKENNAIITYSNFDKLEGLLLYDKEKSVVSINMNRQITRQRFTAAHELGHILMHTQVNVNNFLCPISGVKSDIEKEADSFASNLLMPTDELNRQVDIYQNKNGNVGMNECLLIAEYFGVSFEACVKTICFRLKRFDKNLDNDELTLEIRKYKPAAKRKKLFDTTNDLDLLTNAIDYSYFSSANLNEIISENQNIIEALGNIEMNKYCIETKDELDIFKIKDLNKMLYKYAPYPEYAGTYRTSDNMILGGKIQPVPYTEIIDKMDELNKTIKKVIENIDKYSISEYISMVAKIHYDITILHPFNDGNGRITRGLTNWLLRLKGLCPIYIDSDNRDEYLEALHRIDQEGNTELLQIIIMKSMIKVMAELHDSW